MRLENFLRKNNIKPADFGVTIGVSYTSVYRYLVGLRRPNRRVLPKIVQATNGKVTYRDFDDSPTQGADQ